MRALLALLLALLPCAGYGQALSAADSTYIDSLMTASYLPNGPGAVILVAGNGTPLFRKAYGLASVELNVPNRPEYLFRIGSISKQFTSVAMLQLAQGGKLSLTDDIRTYLPGYNTHGRTITIEHLLTHTSGIPSYTEKPDFIKSIVLDKSKEEIVQFFADDSLLFEPGTDWSYSNSGYVLAGLIIEKVSGKPLEEYLQTNIFTPAGMNRTAIGTYEQVLPGAVTGYDERADSTYRPAAYLSWTWPYAAGAIVTSVDDMMKWDEALYSDKLLARSWLEKAWTSRTLPGGEKTHYGYGWVECDYKGLRLVTHGGGINGFVSNAIRIPSRHLYVVLLSNFTGKDPNDITNQIALRVAGTPLAEPAVRSLGGDALREYTGVYEVNRVGGRRTTNASAQKVYRTITVANDTLFSQRTGSTKNPLLNVGPDLFVFKDSHLYAQFSRDASGRVVSLKIYAEPVVTGPTEVEPRTDLPLPAERAVITLDPAVLARYRGKYDVGGGFILTITAGEGRIFMQPTGQEIVEIYPESETKFFLKVVDASVEFHKDSSGKVTGLVLYQAGRYEARKIE